MDQNLIQSTPDKGHKKVVTATPKRSVVLFFLRTVYLSVFNGSEMNVAHGVCEIADVKESFGAKPGSVSPAESFAKSVVRCNYIPMACSIRNVHGTF